MGQDKRVIAERLQAAMGRVGISGQAELARRVGATPGAINQISTGRTRKSRLLPDVARELRTTIAYLIGDTEDPEKSIADAYDLTADERALLDIYRNLPKKDRAALKLLITRMVQDDQTKDR